MPDGRIEYDHSDGTLYVLVNGMKLGPLTEDQLEEVRDVTEGYFY